MLMDSMVETAQLLHNSVKHVISDLVKQLTRLVLYGISAVRRRVVASVRVAKLTGACRFWVFFEAPWGGGVWF